MFNKIFCSALLCTYFFFSTVSGENQGERLKTSDIHHLMDQIFSQHVEKKEMTSAIMKNSFRIYIEQFDPEGIYLLQSEVAPYLNISDAQMAKLLQEYEQKNLEAYKKLDDTIQKSIRRARQLREEIFRQKMYAQGSGKHFHGYAKSINDLKDRIGNDISLFSQTEIEKYGLAQFLKNEKKMFSLYEQNRKDHENQYLGVENQGKPLSSEERENLFALHVLKSLTKGLDAHSNFLNSNEAFDMKVKLEKGFQGIGIQLRQKDQQVFIAEIMKNGPAEKSGEVKVGDVIIDVDGHPTIGEPLEDVLGILHSVKAPYISLTVERNNQPLKVKLKKEFIPVDEGRVEALYEKFGNGIIGIISLPSFYQSRIGTTTEKDIRSAIEQLRSEGNLRGLIIDLRQNTGGFLTQSVKVAGLFITSGIVVISKYATGAEKFYRDIDGKAMYDGPLVILTSRETASAAEILAQALQDYGVALVVGDERTYGKGTIQSQTVTGNANTAYFKVTVGEYYTVSGNTPQLKGVKADIKLPSPLANAQIGEEFLEYSIPPAKINSKYDDPLQDIDPTLKTWYMTYYTPKVQHRSNYWRDMLPTLQKNSEQRVQKNQEYQTLLKNLNEDTVTEEEIKAVFSRRKKKKPGLGDPQMAEAINIVKDMILLQSRNP